MVEFGFELMVGFGLRFDLVAGSATALVIGVAIGSGSMAWY